jgi:hypothetical protein
LEPNSSISDRSAGSSADREVRRAWGRWPFEKPKVLLNQAYLRLVELGIDGGKVEQQEPWKLVADERRVGHLVLLEDVDELFDRLGNGAGPRGDLMAKRGQAEHGAALVEQLACAS